MESAEHSLDVGHEGSASTWMSWVGMHLLKFFIGVSSSFRVVANENVFLLEEGADDDGFNGGFEVLVDFEGAGKDLFLFVRISVLEDLVKEIDASVQMFVTDEVDEFTFELKNTTDVIKIQYPCKAIFYTKPAADKKF